MTIELQISIHNDIRNDVVLKGALLRLMGRRKWPVIITPKKEKAGEGRVGIDSSHFCNLVKQHGLQPILVKV